MSESSGASKTGANSVCMLLGERTDGGAGQESGEKRTSKKITPEEPRKKESKRRKWVKGKLATKE